jgi:hypothetical protein
MVERMVERIVKILVMRIRNIKGTVSRGFRPSIFFVNEHLPGLLVVS